MTFRTDKLDKEIINDFHLHLGPSVSKKFLKDRAEKNKVTPIFDQFEEEYKKFIDSKKEHKDGARDLKPVWKQFFFIPQIIKTPEDIRLAVVDVVENSEATDLEIRTTPKPFDKTDDWKPYADAFVQGLLDADEKFPDRNPRGMLSLDRTMHTLQDAKKIIDYVAADPTGMLVGIDICGNPDGTRKLTGKDLADAIMYALEKNMGVAIHLGEVDKDFERDEIDHILRTLETWKKQQKAAPDANPLHGKVRLGHAIYLSEAQRSKIKELDLPVEVCPSCHEQLNWCTPEAHPITKIYPPEEKESALKALPGTDDKLIFGSGPKLEAERVAKIMGCSPERRREIAEQQGKFKFSHFSRFKRGAIKTEPELDAEASLQFR